MRNKLESILYHTPANIELEQGQKFANFKFSQKIKGESKSQSQSQSKSKSKSKGYTNGSTKFDTEYNHEEDIMDSKDPFST